MAENYYIIINGEKICVSEEVYSVYRQMRRQERTLVEKDSRNFVLKYEDFADGGVTGEEQIYDFLQPSVEELALTNIIYRKLHKAIEMLQQDERELITAIYFQGYSVHQLAKRIWYALYDNLLQKSEDFVQTEENFRKLKKVS